jgi:pantoate--beta-alanine ligase
LPRNNAGPDQGNNPLWYYIIEMRIITTVKELQNTIKEEDLTPLGLVPTMGALHEGHLSLVRTCTGMCPAVVVSVYVNPEQFNDKNDLRSYPRTPGKDLQKLGKILRGRDIVFTPKDKEMYPEAYNRSFDFGNLDNIMEATSRPGHFQGVAKVVSRLFEIVNPDIAIFGKKDLQQLAVIKRLATQIKCKVKIIGSPIIREPDGVAMSSRNVLLDPEIRKDASAIYKTLVSVPSLLNHHDIDEIKKLVFSKINNIPGFSVDYFEVADDQELIPVRYKAEMLKGKRYFGCIAVKAGDIRLIDNIEIILP